MHGPFFVDDNTGRMLFDPRGAELDLHCDFEEEFCDSFFTTKEPAPVNVRSFLARNGIVTNNKIKVEEYCIKPKNSLFILGTLGENPGLQLSPQPVRESESITSISSGGFSLSLGSVSLFATSNPDNIDGETFGQRFAMPSYLPTREVVRLSAEPGPTKASEMTQQ